MLTKFFVGQVLWFVPRSRRPPYATAIEKVGRKWLTLSCGVQVDAESLYEKTDFQQGRAWLHEQDWRNEVALEQAWSKLKNEVSSFHAPKGLTLENIEQARKLLKLV